MPQVENTRPPIDHPQAARILSPVRYTESIIVVARNISSRKYYPFMSRHIKFPYGKSSRLPLGWSEDCVAPLFNPRLDKDLNFPVYRA